jgi:hypothetical protein
MSVSSREQLAQNLETLKRRSGHSYDTLGRRCHLSRSTLHRICTGRTLPAEFGTIERIAKSCGAKQHEVMELHGHWHRAFTANEDLGSEPVAGAGETIHPGPQPSVRARASRPRPLALASVLLLLIGSIPLLGSSIGRSGEARRAVTAAPAFPPWAQSPASVPPEFFGVTMQSSTGAVPSFQVGAMRFWDSRTRWANLQPRRGEFDRTILDRLVSGAERLSVPTMLTFGGTPAWASPDGPHTVYSDDSRTSPPDDPADWDTFVDAVARAYRGRVRAYELWVVGNDPRFYSGTVAQLVDMTRRAYRIIKAVDSTATVVCPSMGRLWLPEAARTMEEFAALGGYQHCDVAGVKLYQRTASDPPETMLNLVDTIDGILHRAGVHPPIWSTGTAYEIALERPLDHATAAAFAVRFFLVGLYARYYRMYFYSWGGSKIPIVMQTEGAAPTPAALQVEELQRWLHDAAITTCGTGTAVSLPPQVWRCTFIAKSTGSPFEIRWSSGPPVRMTAAADCRITALDGTTLTVRRGDEIAVTASAIRLSV